MAIGRLCHTGIVCAVGRAALEMAGEVVGVGSDIDAMLRFADVSTGGVGLPRAVLAGWGCLCVHFAADVARDVDILTVQGQCADRSLRRATFRLMRCLRCRVQVWGRWPRR